MNQALFSSNMDLWETPQEFFKKLDNEFHFTLDACATPENAKCDKFFTEKDNALVQDWSGNTVFCNPPYSRKGGQDLFVKKAYEESLKPDTVVVMLLPARTDTKRFHKYIYKKAEIRFIEGRLAFELGGKPILTKTGRPSYAPFPSMVVVFGKPRPDWLDKLLRGD
jgi:site-specific DNA-methyltransferase (adenine-specific)